MPPHARRACRALPSVSVVYALMGLAIRWYDRFMVVRPSRHDGRGDPEALHPAVRGVWRAGSRPDAGQLDANLHARV